MAVKRALMFRVGTNGLICAAYEVGIEQGTETKQGSVKPIGGCPKPATEVVQNTGLCSDHATFFRRSLMADGVRKVDIKRGDATV
jgi:hypothetical protein